MTQKFLTEQLNTLPNYYYIDKDRVYGMDVPFVDFKKVKVLRQGVYLGDVIKNRFEPSHSFYMVADFDYKRKVDVTLGEMDLLCMVKFYKRNAKKGMWPYVLRDIRLALARVMENKSKTRFLKDFVYCQIHM